MDEENSTGPNSWVDESFRVAKESWGTWVSRDKDGNKLVTSLSEELCVSATRFYLKGKQDGFPDGSASYDGVVGGKL